MPKKPNLLFDVNLYGELTKYNDTISKGRCRIFYKYANRNSTYITDEFAEKLIASLPYAPVKGIFDFPSGAKEGDFEGHGWENSEGRIYGIVPETPNLTWEKHLDVDGIERDYLCADVLIYTELYPEAPMIFGKSQSMELYPPSIKGSWQTISGTEFYVFEEGAFFGLQVLGDQVEPCFEGAAFFSLYNSLKSFVEKMENTPNFSHQLGGTKIMPKCKKQNRDFETLFSVLNPLYNKENDYTLDYSVLSFQDSVATVYNYSDQKFEKVTYEIVDDKFSIVDKKDLFEVMVEDVAEQDGIYSIFTFNNNSFKDLESTVVDAYYLLQNEKSELESKTLEYTSKIATLETERDLLSTEKDTLIAERDELAAYKLAVETEKKEEVCAKYTDKLSEEVLAKYTADLSKYSVEELKKELSYEVVENTGLVFSHKQAYVPAEQEDLTGIEAILSQYNGGTK